ncbi:MAG: clostripain-related cysteine peptidase [Bacillota bacterium]
MKRFGLIFMLFAVAFAALTGCGKPTGPGGIDGYVYVLDENARTMGVSRTLLSDLEAGTFTAASGATVALNTGQSAISGENGFFLLSGIDPGDYILTITYGSYTPLNLNVHISPGTITHVNINRIPAPQKTWNFLVYLDGDNNLESYAISDINEMEQIGSTADVNILVLVDRIPGYDSSNGDWSGTRLYYVKQDADTSTINSYLLEDLGERDMSNPATLKDFIIYCQKYFPAQHTVLTLWNHGGGVYPRSLSAPERKVKEEKIQRAPEKQSSGARGICWDDTTGTGGFDCLTTDEVASALSNARAITGKKIDIINMDACLMQTLEVAYEWRNEADYLVGSEETVPCDGNDYDLLLGHLTATPSQTPETFAITLVDDYYSYYSSTTYTTYSAIKLGTVFDTFMNNFKALATRLKDTSDHTGVINAWDYTTYFTNYENNDIYDFCQELITYSSDGNVTSAASNLISSFATVVIHCHNTSPYTTIAHGMYILLPGDSVIWSDYSTEYVKLKLAMDTDWNEFISAFVTW